MGLEKYLKGFLHDPIDKVFDIKTHKQRAEEYAGILGVLGIEEAKGPDQIASCMERSLLPKEIGFQEFNEIKHPFTGELIKIKGIDKDAVFILVKDVYKKISNEIIDHDDKKRFLYLWRNLIEVISKELNGNPLKKYISILPAETRVPDHSIWEHLKITSAINAFENFQNNSLFLFTIGPVQSFISQARKTQDLFMGSFLLSYLTFMAIEKAIEDYGPTNIIYPDLYSQPLMDWYLENKEKIKLKNSFANLVHYPSIPNRFVAIIPETEKDKIVKFAEKLEDAVKTEWRNIVSEVLKSFKITLENELKERQISDFPQIYWVAVPWRQATGDIQPNDLKDFIDEREIKRWENLWQFAEKNGKYQPNIGLLYQLLYILLEKSMATRKNLRNFLQSGEPGRKCSICGEKEATIKAEDGELKIGKFIREGEKLCIICFAKRGLERYLEGKFGNLFKDFSFPSTAEVALSDFKKKALENVEDKLKEYIGKFKELTKDKFQKTNPLPILKELFKDIENLEGEWFFEDNLTRRFIEKNLGISLEAKKIEGLKQALKNLTNNIGKPNPYYAVIMLDADDMARWLSGENLPSIENAYNSDVWQNMPISFKQELEKLSPKKILTPAIHSTISTALKNYSIEFVRKIVEEEHLGKLVYSGGDDVLAFVNPKDLFDVMRKLRGAFSSQIKFKNGKIEVDWENTTGFVDKDGEFLLTMGKNATASMGVVIAHYKMPLRIALKKVRDMLKKAKDSCKDSFAIALLKHSGEERVGVSKLRYEDLDVLESLKELSEVMDISKKPHLSDKFIYNLHQELSKLTDENSYFKGTGEIFNVELKRLIKRGYDGRDKEKKKAFVGKKSEILSNLFWSTGGNLDNFIGLLSVSAFISKKEKE